MTCAPTPEQTQAVFEACTVTSPGPAAATVVLTIVAVLAIVAILIDLAHRRTQELRHDRTR